jgi:hypothetical protein
MARDRPLRLRTNLAWQADVMGKCLQAMENPLRPSSRHVNHRRSVGIGGLAGLVGAALVGDRFGLIPLLIACALIVIAGLVLRYRTYGSIR